MKLVPSLHSVLYGCGGFIAIFVLYAVAVDFYAHQEFYERCSQLALGEQLPYDLELESEQHAMLTENIKQMMMSHYNVSMIIPYKFVAALRKTF